MHRIKHLSFALIAVLTLSLASCGGGGGGDDTPALTPAEQRLLDLAGTSGVTYAATSVTRDGQPNDEYDNFTITLRTSSTSNTYTTTDNEPVFNSSGTWEISTSNINQVVLDGSRTATISNFDAAAGTFTLTIGYTAPGGAAAGLSGEYKFNLVKQ